MSSTKVEVPGQAVWVLKVHAFPQSEFEPSAKYKWSVSSAITSSKSDMESLAKEHSSSSSQDLSLTAGVKIDIVSVSSTAEFGWTQSALNRTTRETTSEQTEAIEETTEIGPVPLESDQCIYIFQKKLRFSSREYPTPEVLIHNSSTPPELDEPVTLRIPVTVSSSSYLEKIDVHTYDGHVYSEDFMQVIGHETDKSENVQDLNKGFEGKYAYLEPKWTTDASQAADHIEVTVASDFPEWAKEKGLKDVAEGAGGDYRFIEAQNTGESKKIVAAQLWDGELYRTPDGWDGYSEDLNKGREGRYLYIVYKLCET